MTNSISLIVSLVISLDAIDKQLWIELRRNCRYSYRYLGDKIGISANAVKHRVEKLLETGFIRKWHLSLSLAMIDGGFAFIEVKTDGSKDEDELMKGLGDHPNIFVLLPLTTGDFALHAHYTDATSLLEIGSYIRSLDGITDVKVHPTRAYLGKKMNLNSLHLRILPWLLDDPRASVTEIAKKTGLTARRVGKLVDELVSSEALNFSYIWNPNAGDSIAFICRIRYNPKETESEVLDNLMRKTYKIQYFYSHVSVIEPVLFSVFLVDHLFNIQEITKQVRKMPGVKALNTVIYYSVTVLTPLTEKKLVELLDDFKTNSS